MVTHLPGDKTLGCARPLCLGSQASAWYCAPRWIDNPNLARALGARPGLRSAPGVRRVSSEA